MQRDQMSIRNFKGGSWDLRKDERRKESQTIGFPERRAIERRGATRADDSAGIDMLQWVTKSALDE